MILCDLFSISLRCEDHGECRYYYWYPIDYSPAPLYCYLYRSCLGGADEERVGIVVGGRHPGHYFLGKNTIRYAFMLTWITYSSK